MPRFWKRNEQPEPERTAPAVAALITSVESRAGELRDGLSHRDFRHQVKNAGRSSDEVWVGIRSAALARERRDRR